ncbi:hypothetical protein IAR50_007368 [Cryptococcus sp. DSM 104548]
MAPPATSPLGSLERTALSRPLLEGTEAGGHNYPPSHDDIMNAGKISLSQNSPRLDTAPTAIPADPISSELVRVMRQVLERLEKRLSLAEASAAAQPKLIYTSVELAREPPTFGGNRKKLEQFIMLTQLYFDAYPSSFSSDHRKIIFTLSYLRGPVFEFFVPFMKYQPPPPFLKDYSLLLAQLRLYWGLPEVSGRRRRNGGLRTKH